MGGRGVKIFVEPDSCFNLVVLLDLILSFKALGRFFISWVGLHIKDCIARYFFCPFVLVPYFFKVNIFWSAP
jgi:hypothetical protein